MGSKKMLQKKTRQTKKIVGIIQARMGSKRLPGKSMKILCGKPLLYYVIERVKMAETLDTVVLATSKNKDDDVIEDLARDLGIEIYRGSEEDVLDRFINAAKINNADVIVRVCADNPLISKDEIDRIVKKHMNNKADYSFNHIPRKNNNYPDGLGSEVVDFVILEKIAKKTNSSYHREHVTTYIWDNPNEFSIETIRAPYEITGPDIKLDVDTEEDFYRIESFIQSLPSELSPAWSSKNIVKSYRDYFKTKTLVFLEHENQVQDYLKWSNGLKGKKIVIALSPFAIYELEKQGIPYSIPDDYYTPKELYSYGKNNFNKVKKLCGLIDKHIEENCPIFKKIGITPATFSIFSFKIIYDAVTVRIFQLFKIIKAENPDVLFAYDVKEYPFKINSTNYLSFDNRESIYTSLFKLNCWKQLSVLFPIVPESESNLTKTHNDSVKFEIKNKVLNFIQKKALLYDIFTTFKQTGIKGIIYKLTMRRNGNLPVLLLGEHNWNECQEEFLSIGIGPILKIPTYQKDFLTEPDMSKIDQTDLLNTWKNLNNDKEFKKFFISEEIDFFELLKDRIQYTIEVLSIASYNSYSKITEVLKKKKIEAVLTSTFTTCIDYSISRAANNLNIPIINWQVGSYGYYEQMTMAEYDTMASDFYFVFGKKVAEHIAETTATNNTQLIPVGSTSLDKLNSEKGFSKSESKKKIVLYVTTNYYQNFGYVSFFPPFSDNHFWLTQKGILEVLGRHSDYDVIVKLHPVTFCRDPPMSSFVSENGYENIRFIKYKSQFTELIQQADIIVIDFPTTTLLQSLTTYKPIFVYFGHNEIHGDVLPILKKRAFSYGELEEFLHCLDKFLRYGKVKTGVDLKDQEFLKICGTHNLDGKSGKRAAELVKNIISKRHIVKEIKDE